MGAGTQEFVNQGKVKELLVKLNANRDGKGQVTEVLASPELWHIGKTTIGLQFKKETNGRKLDLATWEDKRREALQECARELYDDEDYVLTDGDLKDSNLLEYFSETDEMDLYDDADEVGVAYILFSDVGFDKTAVALKDGYLYIQSNNSPFTLHIESLRESGTTAGFGIDDEDFPVTRLVKVPDIWEDTSELVKLYNVIDESVDLSEAVDLMQYVVDSELTTGIPDDEDYEDFDDDEVCGNFDEE